MTMRWLGEILAAPVRLMNAPLRAAERLVAPDDDDPERLVSLPLESLAKALKEIGDDE